MFQDKTQTAENGLVLLKGCTKSRRPQATQWGHLGSSLRASWEAVDRGAASLGKDRAITCMLQPHGQPLPNSLNSQLSHGRSTSGPPNLPSWITGEVIFSGHVIRPGLLDIRQDIGT